MCQFLCDNFRNDGAMCQKINKVTIRQSAKAKFLYFCDRKTGDIRGDSGRNISVLFHEDNQDGKAT